MGRCLRMALLAHGFGRDMHELLQAVYEDLDNDLPRLVYADWLEEQGDPHADLIRIQCRLAEIPPYGAEFVELCRAEWRWIQSHRRQLLSSCPERLGDPTRNYANRRAVHLDRGFPESMHLVWDGVPDEVAVLLKAYPTIRDLEIASTNWHPRYVQRFVKLLEYSHRIRFLSPNLMPMHMEHVILSLSDAERWPCLTQLQLRVDGRDLRRLAEGGVLDRLESLTLDLEAEGGAEMRDIPPLESLKTLIVHADSDVLVGLVNSTRFPNVADLTLRVRSTVGSSEGTVFSGIGDAGIASSLAYDEGWENLRWLALRHNQFGEEALVQLLTSPLMNGLRRLDLLNNTLPPLFFPTLCETANLQTLEFLEVSPFLAHTSGIYRFLTHRAASPVVLGLGTTSEAKELYDQIKADGFSSRLQPPVSRWT